MFIHRHFGVLAPVLFLFLAAGCATTPGPSPTPQPTPDAVSVTEPAGLVEKILEDLAANDAAIHSFQASGKFMLKSPELQDVQVLRQSSIRFQRPADLHVVGRKYSKAVFKLTCAGDGFLVVLPTERSYFASSGGARFQGVSREVSPRDIANEMFFPEDWAKLNPDTVALADLSADGAQATLHVYTSRRRAELRRTVKVQGPPWRVVETARFDGGKEPVAVTTLSNYQDAGGVGFATLIDSSFPSENAFMQFDASNYEINTELNPEDFDLDAQLDEVLADGYQEMEERPTATP